MHSQIEVVVTKRNKELTKGVFKVGTEITIDLDDMVAYHSGLQWNVKQVSESVFALSDGETTFKVIG